MEKIQNDLTPMMQQYLQLKRDHKDAILFFRLGDFYEMFFEDAKIASSILGLALTSRGSGKNSRVPMCGIPYHASANYIARLIKAERKVAVCEQIGDPGSTKGIVERQVVRVITPGTLVDQNILDSDYNNYLVSVYRKTQGEYGLAVVDLSTGEFKVTQMQSIEKMLSELGRLHPAELILCPSLKSDESIRKKIKQRNINALVSEVEEWVFEYSYAYEKLLDHFKTRDLRGFGAQGMNSGIIAAGAVLSYLENTQKTEIKHINKITPYSLNKVMVLDGIAQRNLELVRSMRGDKKGTLLSELNFTNSAMGNRLLVQWLQQPLLDIEAIDKRLNAIEQLKRDQVLRTNLRDKLKNILDIERLLGRISLGVANARDVLNLNESLKIIPQIKQQLLSSEADLLISIRDNLDEQKQLVELLDKALSLDAPLSVREGRMIKEGYNRQLDELKYITRGGKEWIAKLQREEIKRTGITSLKIKYNRVFGYYIEVSKANLHAVPDDYMRKQTLVNAERFITPALKEQEEKIITAQEKMNDLECQLFLGICKTVLLSLIEIQNAAALIASLDVLNSLSEAAARNNYVRPVIDNDLTIDIKGGRHPVLENMLSANKFIPNPTYLNAQENQILIITGPNMAGKSTYIRQVALIIIMAQIGSFVPAKSAHIGIVDKIFTRVGAADDISAGMSTFMMEMSETANILNNATSRSMIILDEIGRGTSTFDGLSIAWATAEYLHDNSEMKPKTLFATHYHELTEMELLFKGVKNYNVSVREWNDEVIFLYKLIRGSSDHSYGIHVARLAGLPNEVIIRAREILSNLEINSMSADGIPSLVKSDIEKRRRKEVQPELFQNRENPLIAKIRGLDINNLNPIKALNLINEWKESLKKEE
ncbi:MAG: DNA mismatch repair protein MutS [Candidatus Omnitrophica bacterium]|nr:DNA mismatch repair protein MutS [Candidatus Omnitrophota bacterium]